VAKAKIIGTGIYVPGTPIKNDELWKLTGVEYDEEKLAGVIGIKQRHMAKLRGIKESTADFATNAAKAAIADAGIDPLEVKLFIVGSDTPEYISPGTAILVQGRIQGKQMLTGCFDISCSCAGFATSFDVGARMVATDPSINYAVIIGAYNMPAFIREDDAFGLAIFADGAGAVVLQKTDDGDISGYIGGQLLSDGTQWDFIGIYTGGAKKPFTKELIDKKEYGLQNLKPLPGDRNIKLWPHLTQEVLKKCRLTTADINHIIFTQINKSVILKVMELLDLPIEKTTMVMDKYGYTGSGCIPMTFYHALRAGKIKRGDTVVFVASGSGLFVGSNVFNY